MRTVIGLRYDGKIVEWKATEYQELRALCCWTGWKVKTLIKLHVREKTERKRMTGSASAKKSGYVFI